MKTFTKNDPGAVALPPPAPTPGPKHLGSGFATFVGAPNPASTNTPIQRLKGRGRLASIPGAPISPYGTVDTKQYVVGGATFVATPSAFSVPDNTAVGTGVVTISASDGGTVSNLGLSGTNSTDFAFNGATIQVATGLNAGTRPSYTLSVSGKINGTVATPITVLGTVTASGVGSGLLLADGASSLFLADGSSELLLA